ncbi:MAG TPA: CvpA family protein [Candidatus Limnocylindria bacterium]|nr:CvpA family protein [Candidatus Limnocylindria bacterium]
MNPVDLAIVAVLFLAAVAGVRSGFVRTVYGLLSWIASLVVALVLQAPLGDGLAAAAGWPVPAARSVALAILLVLAQLAFAVLGTALVTPAAAALGRHRLLGPADRALGVVPGIARAVLILAVILAASLALPLPRDARSAIDRSSIARVMLAEVAALQPRLGDLMGADGSQPLFVTRLGADDRQSLDLPEGLALEVDPEAERELVRLVNEERSARGLGALALDERLVSVARLHSEEMFRLRYFGHVSPVTGSPFDRLAKAGIPYARAGENLAYARSVATAHRGLMESPGHRENILRPEYARIGVGAVSAGPYGRMFTQLFLAP